ncbi:hypothetical protein SAMN04489745_0771 [Arthrobacter woluwensis]|uniref:Uncharacterized protein n=1 Tax=Arthrobacter woluwensis TaxID=156980 RepID=A0A1H4KS06_9MICC|nr:hypothetical protein [Arthrobacter woluwensis]SEB61183.1 hypothetical protein SAMN04489745_0771 [Arthrobacter woluwensis]
MCYPTTCKVCGKTTWSGCGEHIASVKRSVPAAQWCDKVHTEAEIAAARDSRPGLFSRIFGR